MRICLELFWSKRVDFLFIYLFFFCLLVIINEGGKCIGIMASPLTSWISLIIFIFEEKNIWAKYLKFNALRPLIFELLQVQYLFRIDFWIFFIVKNENLVIFVYMYKMTKENCISEETNCPILTV